MTRKHRFIAILLAAAMTAGFCMQVFAGPNKEKAQDVPVTWSDLSLNVKSGSISFTMEVNDSNGIEYIPDRYAIDMYVIRNGVVPSSPSRRFTIVSSQKKVSESIEFYQPGVYWFEVTCIFTGGMKSANKGKSEQFTVTRDDVTDDPSDDNGGGTHVGPGGSFGTPSAVGKSGWYQEPNTKKWYYAATTGTWLKNTWQFINNNWYYFDNDCSMHTGWLSESGKWYYLHPIAVPEGHRAAGFERINEKWYYFEPTTGVMLTGVIQVGGAIYCMDSSGAMLMNTGTPDGHYYGIDGRRVR